MSAEKRILAFLELAEKDAEATELLAAGSNRNAAYHLQQAIEKLLKAVLIARQIETTAEHRLEPLLDQLASDDPGSRASRPSRATRSTRRRFAIRRRAAASPMRRRSAWCALTTPPFASCSCSRGKS